MSYPVKIDRRVFVPMEDGTRVALTLYLPDAPGDGPFPAVVESLPYRKDDEVMPSDYRTYTYLAERGIAGVRIDIRGTGASTGVILNEYVPQEQADTIAVFDWLETRDWCDGNLGMWGISWGGFSSLQTAMLRPPQLRAIAPMHATHDRFACDVHYTGGSAHAAEQLDWPGSMVCTNALPPDPEIVGDGWYEEWMTRLEETPQWIFEWFRHQRRDDYWLHGSPCADYEAIECPTLLIGGWLDGYVDGMLAMAEKLSCPTRTVIGPWGHYRPATGVPGPTLDHFDLLYRWFGHHLRGDDNGVMDMAPVTVFVRDQAPFDAEVVSGRWRTETGWPPDDASLLILGLADLEHGPVEWSGPQWVGSHSPFWDPAGFHAIDSAGDDAVSMHFTTGPFEDPVEILGAPVVETVVTSDQPFGLLAARLIAVDPAGRGHMICRASRNLAFPDDLSTPVAPTPGEPIEISLSLRATSAVIPAGWSLRLSLAGADFPVVWPPKGSFTLTLDPTRSRLVLPIVGPRPEDRWLEVPEGTVPESPAEETRSVAEWEVVKTPDENIYRRVRGGTEHHPNVTYTYDQWWTVTVGDDPASTHARTFTKVSLERPGWAVTTEGTIDISAGEVFDIEVQVLARHDGEQISERRWREEIPREWA